MSNRMDKCKCGHYKGNHYQAYSEYDEKGKWKKYVDNLEGCKVPHCSCQKFAKCEKDDIKNDNNNN